MTATLSARKIDPADYDLIHRSLTDMVARLKRSKRKAMYAFLDVEAAITSLYAFDHAYIVSETYLVVYDIGEPWYAIEGASILAERLILRLAVSGPADFTVVPRFLESRALEAGCTLVVVGTALAKSDAALASLYIRSGFKAETITLTKEPGWAD